MKFKIYTTFDDSETLMIGTKKEVELSIKYEARQKNRDFNDYIIVKL